MPKWFSFALLLCAAFVAVQSSAAQDNPSPSAAPESSAQGTAADSALALAPDPPDPPAEGASPDPIPVQPPAPVPAPSEWRILGSQWKSLAPDLLHEQKRMWLFPTSIVRGHHLKPTLALLGATALLTTVDAHNATWVRNSLRPLGGFNNAFAGYNTATATEAFASAFYLIAIARRNAYDQQTFMLAGEAVINAEILTTVMKDVDGREAPISYPAGGDFKDSWFKVRSGTRSGWVGGLGSMPSGHEIAIMAVATTFAERYPHPAWHRWLAYGLAAAAGLSRVTLQSHFTSDTFAGAALGYVIARYVVLARQPKPSN
jgi:membrane-associated phospholipid phosphatase